MAQRDMIWFHAAVERHRDTVFRVAFNYLRSAADADDVCQDTFVALYRSGREFESDEHLKAWLIRVTINRCKSMFRRPWARIENIDDYADQIEAPQQGRELLGNAVQHVGLSCEAEGYVLTVDDLVMDDQGVGVATFTLTAPDGTSQFIGASDDRFPDYGYLNLVQGPDTQLHDIVVRGTGNELFDHYAVVDLTQTTDEVLHGVLYFGAMEEVPDGGMVFGLVGQSDEDGQAGEPDMWEARTEAFAPGVFVDSVKLADGRGHTAYVSPIGITYAAPFGEGGSATQDEYWSPNNIVIKLADGSEYMVKSDDLVNSYCGYYTTGGAMTLVFNRLVDPDAVASVTVDGPNGTTLVFNK